MEVDWKVQGLSIRETLFIYLALFSVKSLFHELFQSGRWELYTHANSITIKSHRKP